MGSFVFHRCPQRIQRARFDTGGGYTEGLGDLGDVIAACQDPVMRQGVSRKDRLRRISCLMLCSLATRWSTRVSCQLATGQRRQQTWTLITISQIQPAHLSCRHRRTLRLYIFLQRLTRPLSLMDPVS